MLRVIFSQKLLQLITANQSMARESMRHYRAEGDSNSRICDQQILINTRRAEEPFQFDLLLGDYFAEFYLSFLPFSVQLCFAPQYDMNGL